MTIISQEFLEILSLNGTLVPKRCTEYWLVKHNLMDVLDSFVDPSFGSLSDRVRHVKYGGGYCATCGARTRPHGSGEGFNKHCHAHYKADQIGQPAHNRSQINIGEVLSMYYIQQLTLIEIAERYGFSNVTLSNRLKAAGFELRSHQENQRLHSHLRKSLANQYPKSKQSGVKTLNTLNTLSTSNALNIDPYLNESNLEEVLKFVFSCKVDRQQRFQLNHGHSKKNAIVDYCLEIPGSGQNMIVEFNGPRHYTSIDTITRDYDLREYCKINGIRLVEIPYFVQLTNDNFPQYFGMDMLDFLKDKRLTCSQTSGFLAQKIILPMDFCWMGLKRYVADVLPVSHVSDPTPTDTSAIFEATTREIYESLWQRSRNDVTKLEDFLLELQQGCGPIDVKRALGNYPA